MTSATTTTEQQRCSDPHTPGTFIIIRINPQATVAPLQDEEVDDAAGKMVTKKYLAWIFSTALDHAYGQVNRCFILFIASRRPPTFDDFALLDETSFLPIWPTEHPQGREPLRPNQDLPWSGCLQPSRQPLMFSISTEYTENPSGTKLPQAAAMQMLGQSHEDMDRLEESLQIVEHQSEGQGTGEENWVVTYFEDGSHDSLLDDIDVTSNSDSEPGEHDSLSGEESLLQTLLASVDNAPPKIDVWLDLSTAAEIGDAEDFFEEMKQIRTLKAAAKEKIEADLQTIAQMKAQKLNWVRQATKALEKELSDAMSVHTIAAGADLPDGPEDMAAASEVPLPPPPPVHSKGSPVKFNVVALTHSFVNKLRYLWQRS